MSGWRAHAASLGCAHKAMPNDRVGSRRAYGTVQSSALLCNGTVRKAPVVGRTVPGRPG